MSSIYFSNYELKEDTDYFLYVGELKNYGLNSYLAEALERSFNRKFGFIAIVPDVCEQYNYSNLIVINPLVETCESGDGDQLSSRVSSTVFAGEVSNSREIKELIKQILKRQKTLYLYMFESLTEMTLDALEGVSILGPDKAAARRLNSKIYQARQLSGLVPFVDFHICDGYDALISKTAALWDDWCSGIFITREYSAAGVGSVVAFSKSDIDNKFNGSNETYMISRFVPHDHDPTVLGVVAGKSDVYIAGVADQNIEAGNRFTGSVFPSVLGPDVQEALKEHTRTIGTWLAGEGYLGIFGCDYIVTKEGDIKFLEINARKQGTTLEFCCTLEQLLPLGSPMLPELEFHAVTQRRFPVGSVEAKVPEAGGLHWGTYNYKIHSPVKTTGYIPQNALEREAFKKVALGDLEKDYLILEHVGSDFVVAEGTFIGRVVALGRDRESVNQGLLQGRRTLELTFVNT